MRHFSDTDGHNLPNTVKHYNRKKLFYTRQSFTNMYLINLHNMYHVYFISHHILHIIILFQQHEHHRMSTKVIIRSEVCTTKTQLKTKPPQDYILFFSCMNSVTYGIDSV